MDSLAFPADWIWRPILIAASFAVTFFFSAGLILSFWKVDIDIAPARKAKRDTSPVGPIETAQDHEEVRRVTVELHGYGLEVGVRHFRVESRKKTILHPLTATFEPEKINVIMGPSGSGKTSLLQSVAQRLDSNLLSNYQFSSQLTLNGAIPSASVIRSVASFVTQDDDVLIPYLTVRKTVHFAAGPRLPSWISRQEKSRRTEEVLVQMGLKDCAHSLIGNEFKEEISGGENEECLLLFRS